MSHSMRELNTRVEFVKSDFDFSDQVTAEAKTVKVFGVDWARLFKKKVGTTTGNANVVSIPVIGNYFGDRTSEYALYNLMENNPGYDVVFYPQYEKKVKKPFLGLGFIIKTSTVKTTARLGKLRESTSTEPSK